MNVLWIAPNLNHYKARFLAKLNSRGALDITVISGANDDKQGHVEYEEQGFRQLKTSVTKESFGFSLHVYFLLRDVIKHSAFEYVLMPLEKKNTFLIIYLYLLKKKYNFKLITYNHPMIRYRITPNLIEKIYPMIMFMLYDRVIFYTLESMERAIANNLISKQKARHANNTIDTNHIWQTHSFKINEIPQKRLLVIGRLVPYRNIDLLLEYYRNLKDLLPDIELVVIGDGPESYKIIAAAEQDSCIYWKGAIIDEKLIGDEMDKAHAVFMPGHSGLSIVHAFAYGKPYITLSTYTDHPPEIDYLDDSVNGLLLSGNLKADSMRIVNFLLDSNEYKSACLAAFEKAKELSVENWCVDIETALVKK